LRVIERNVKKEGKKEKGGKRQDRLYLSAVTGQSGKKPKE